MKASEVASYLFERRDEKLAAFSKKLSNSDYEIIGIKIPSLRDFVKEHLHDEELDPKEFSLGIYLEIDYLYFGFSLSRCSSVDEQYDFLIENIHKAKSWAVTDTLSKFIKKSPFKKFFGVFMKLAESPYIYSRRMAYVLGIAYAHDNEVLSLLPEIKPDDEYVVVMAQAWFLSVVGISYPRVIYEYLRSVKSLDLKKKTISKICDSYRYDQETKLIFKSLLPRK